MPWKAKKNFGKNSKWAGRKKTWKIKSQSETRKKYCFQWWRVCWCLWNRSHPWRALDLTWRWGTIVGSGSYGTCELKNSRNIKVCVKKVHKNANAADVKHQGATLNQLQLSLYVPVLLGFNVISKPFYIVTKFHSAMTESTLTLHRAIKKCTIGKSKWMSILHKCALGIKYMNWGSSTIIYESPS